MDHIDKLGAGSPASEPRRGFLRTGLALGGGLLIGFQVERANSASAAVHTPFEPNAYIRIDTNGIVTLTMSYVEMGQGTYTAIPMLIAEELEVDLGMVRLEHAAPSDKLFSNPMFGNQTTGGSTSIRAAWEPMRRAGATARTLLITAAAQRWKVMPSSCRAQLGKVIHLPSGRTLKYGDLAGVAAGLPLPAAEEVLLKKPDDFKLIGTPAKRLDASEKVNGSAQYGIDVRLPGMLVAALVASPVVGGKLRKLDDRMAKKVKGVRQVVRLDDAVAVVADHTGAARKGLAALLIEWDDGPNAAVSSEGILHSMELASRDAGAVAYKTGDVDTALAGAASRQEAVYQLPFLAHAAMEPMNCTVHLRKDSCEIWTGTQVITRAQMAAAQACGLPLEKVIVHNQMLGGGFGRRLEVDGVVRAVQVARHVPGPVKVVWSREEDIQHDLFRPYFYDRMAGGLDARGELVAWHHCITGSSVLARWYPPAFSKGLDHETVDGAANQPYAIPNLLIDYVQHEPPGVPTAFWRGVGPAHNVFVVESFIDELAAKAARDPVAYRSTLLANSPRAQAVLKLAADKAGWGKTLPAGSGRGISLQFAFGTYMAQVAEVRVGKDGEVSVTRIVCALDAGIIVNPDTVRAQVSGGIIFGLSAALYGEITLKNGRVEQSNFHDYRVLRINEVPQIEVHIIASAEAPGGMGEPATAAVAPAVTNAIFAAIGRRLRRLPIGTQLQPALPA